jgi:tetratricopeptide (TPR) repeat protein
VKKSKDLYKRDTCVYAMGLVDIIRKSAMIAAGALWLANSPAAQESWDEVTYTKTADGKDTVIIVPYEKSGSTIYRHNSDGSVSVEDEDGSITGPGRSGYRDGSFIRETRNDGSHSISQVLYSERPKLEDNSNSPANPRKETKDIGSVANSAADSENLPQKAQEEFSIGKDCYDRKDYNCAREHFEKAVGLDKSNIVSSWTLAQTYRFLGKDFFDRALENYDICIEKDFKKGDAYACVASIFASRFYHSQSKEKTREALEKGARLGNSYCKKGLDNWENILKEEGMN